MSDKLTNEQIDQASKYYLMLARPCARSEFSNAEAVFQQLCAQARANAQGEAVAWRVKVGASDIWGYAEHEDMADLRGQQSGLKYVKQPLYAHPPMPDSLPEEPNVGEQLAHARSCPSLTPLNDDACTCGLIYRQHEQTAVNISAAWRKRAEEAELELDALRAHMGRK